MDDLNALMDVWEVVNARMESADLAWTSNSGIRKQLNLLNMYPNEFWKYPVGVFYLTHKDNDDFEEKFLRFLSKFAAE